MKWVLCSALSALLYGQSELLRLADSLSAYGEPVKALALYDSLLYRSGLPDSLRLLAYTGSLRPLIFLRQLAEADIRIDSAEQLALKLRDTLRYGAAHSSRGEILMFQNSYTAAETTLHAVLEMLRGQYEKTDIYATTLHRMGILWYIQGSYQEAEKWFRTALLLKGQVLGTDHPDYAWSLNNLAVVLLAAGKYAEAEKLHLEVKAILSRALGTNHPDYASALNNMANTYSAQGRYADSEKVLLEVEDIQARILGIEHPEYASTLNNLANVYADQGRYAEAEKLYLEVRDLQARILGIDHPYYATALNNLAVLYYSQGRYAEAEKLYLEVKEIRARVLGTDHPDYALSLNNLAIIYTEQKKYADAERLYREAARIQTNALGVSHPDYASTLNNLATVYREQGRFAEAESLCLEVREIRIRALGEDHLANASLLNNLALIYEAQERYTEAEKLYREAAQIQADVLGKDHPDYYSHSLYNLARLYTHQKRYKEADALWNEVIEKTFSRIRRDFLSMPTAHRQQLLENLLVSNLQGFQRYAGIRGKKAFIERGYRVARSVKGLLLSSAEAMKWLVESKKNDTTLQRLYADWHRLSEQYAAFTMREDYETADALWQQMTLVEKSLVERLPDLSSFFPDLEKEPLFPHLKKGEVAVELIRISADTGDAMLYMFYLIEGGKKSIKLHLWRVDPKWEQQGLLAYEILRSPGAEITGTAYRLLWSFIDSLIPASTRVVYFAPDGIYHRVNIASLYDGKGFVIDRYDVRYIATTRRLIVRRPELPAGGPIVIGNPDFRGTGTGVSERRERGYRSFPYGIPPLPGAEEEAKAVAHLLDTEAAIGAAATESYLKTLRSPRILHIATHGYFAESGKSSILEGGILLAQAALWDSLYPPLETDDGRLTAQEASTLNLLGTDLVVLSACETGLGEVKGEGLYGLQRAFLEAGAGRVITTLWQIDDEATRMLMEDFYRRWRTMTGAGAQPAPTGKAAEPAPESLIDTAFNETLRDFRRRYPEPYYWGAFVLMR